MGFKANGPVDEIAIGKVRTSYGVKGEIKILSYSGETSHFNRLQSLVLSSNGKRREYTVESVRAQGDTPLLKLEGINTPEDAKLLSGAEILVPRDNAAPLEKGEFYHADLCRCSLVFDKKVIGQVLSIIPGGNGELLEIKNEKGESFFVPFHEHFIGKINIKALTIELLDGSVLP